ncbi:MAG: TspO/MBR family protein [Halobacteriota archaeon]
MDFTDRVWSLADRRPWVALVVAVVATELVGASGAVFTSMGLASWYPQLARPALAPPNWVFGPVWTTLFALMGVAVWLVWKEATGELTDVARFALGIFVVHFAINLAWSGVFFGLQSLLGGLIVIAVLWLLIVATIWAFARVDRRAGVLLVPYLAWVSFAGYLNYAFWLLN